MTRRQIDLDQVFVGMLDGEPWLPDVTDAAIRAGRRRQRRGRVLVVAATAAAVAGIMVVLPSLGILPGRGGEPTLAVGPPSPTLAPGAPLAVGRPPLDYATEAPRQTRDGAEWVMARIDVLGPNGERAPQVPGQLRAAVVYELYDRHGEAAVGDATVSSRDYDTSWNEGKPLAWVDSSVRRPGSGPLAVKAAVWLSHPASWEGCGVGEVACEAQAVPDSYATVVSYRVATRDPRTGKVVSSWWARARKYNGLFATAAVQVPLGREEAVQLALDSVTMTY